MRKSLILTFIIICLFSGIIIGYYIEYTKYAPEIENYKAKISTLSLEISKLNSIISNKSEENLILQINLTKAKNTILNYSKQISKLELELANYEEQINILKEEKSTLQSILVQAENSISFLKNKINEYELKIENYSKKISELETKVSYLKSQTLYSNPTYNELKEFIKKDKTNENKYIPDKYVCTDFAADVNNNAEKQGIRCGFVLVYFKSGGAHALVAFETIDKGLVFIEPQADKEVNVKIGIRYWVDNGFSKPNYDDTITKILIIW